MRKLRDKIKRAEVPLYYVTAIAALYLAAGNVLRGAKVPSESFWAPWSWRFIVLLVAAVYVPLYALYKTLDAYYEGEDRKAAQATEAQTSLSRDLDVLCQQVVAEIADACPQVSVNDLAAQVWLCRPDGSFDRRSRFFLPHERKSSGIVWSKGKGVAGLAWQTNHDLRSDLRPILEKLRRLGASAFDALPAAERLGLSAVEVESTQQYTGICAICLFSADESRTLLGIFVIDYTGAENFDCVAKASLQRRVNGYLGGCERRLTASTAIYSGARY